MTRFPLTRRTPFLIIACLSWLWGYSHGKWVEATKYRSVTVMFKPATKEQSRGRVALIGPAGSGKSFTGLIIATTLANGGKVAVIDSERGSASKYAELFAFDVCELSSFAPLDYVKFIHEAEAAGYAALLIDSLTHAWSGVDGALEQVDRAAARMRSPNSYTAWREVTPMHNALVDAMLQSPMHIVATMRAKTEYILEDDGKGKKVPRKVGMAPVQRDGMEYEFDVTADLDWEHQLVVSKSRCPAVDGAVIRKPDKKFAQAILDWLMSGVAPATRPATVPFVPPPPPKPEPKAPPTRPAARQKPSPSHITACKSEKQLVALIAEWYARDDFQIVGNEAKWAKVLDTAEEHLSTMGGATAFATEALDTIRDALELASGVAATLPEGEAK
jgi:hypothetical protein